MPAQEPPYFRGRRSSRPIGPFAFLVMKAVAKLSTIGYDQAYGRKIHEIIRKDSHIGDVAQIYVVLKRLTARGFLKAEKVAAPGGSSHTVTVYGITPEGAEAVLKAQRTTPP